MHAWALHDQMAEMAENMVDGKDEAGKYARIGFVTVSIFFFFSNFVK